VLGRCADATVCLLISAIQCVFHLLNQVSDGISICDICKNDGVYDISYRHMSHNEQKSAIQLCFIDRTPDRYLI